MAWSSPRTWVTGETVTAAQMNQEVRDNLDFALPDGNGAVSWTPVLEASTGDDTRATVTGRYYQVGAKMRVWVQFTWSGIDPDFTGTPFVTLPTAASGVAASSTLGQVVGLVYIFNADTTNRQLGGAMLASTTTVQFVGPSGSLITRTSPFTWATGDALTFEAEYPVA